MTMNKPIRTIAIFCLLLFVALMVNATYLQYFQADELGDDPLNRRVINAAYARERGSIIVGRDPVAQSLPVDDQYKFLREYPEPYKYAPVTGHFAYQFGASAIERTQNDVLSGEDDRLFVTRMVDLLSNDGTRGGNVQLTLNRAAQEAAFDALSSVPGDVRGSVVALEPRTGKVLAMVSLPTYDPNLLSSHDFGAVQEEWQRLSDDEGEPMLNRATQRTLPPGSTFKLVTAAAALESGNYSSADDLVPGGPTYQLPLTSGPTGQIGNEGRNCGSNRIPFSQAMEQSCNTTFAALAGEVGADALREQAEAFGFNGDYLTDLRPQAVSEFPTDLDDAQLGQAGFGQFSVRSTPLQMAMVVAGIANNGDVMRPYVVDEVQSADLDVVEGIEPEKMSEAMSPASASALTDMLVSTVDNGTARPAAISGISVAGKTGTAQSGREDVPPYAWFVSFAPADDPQVAVAVMIEKAGDIPRGEIGGGSIGGPIAKAVMEAVIKR